MEFILVYGIKQESKCSPGPLPLPSLLFLNPLDSGTHYGQFLNKQNRRENLVAEVLLLGSTEIVGEALRHFLALE